MVTFRSFLKLMDKLAPPGIDMYITVSGMPSNALRIVRGARYAEFGSLQANGTESPFVPIVTFEHNIDNGPVIVKHVKRSDIPDWDHPFGLDDAFCWGNETNHVDWWRAVNLDPWVYGWFQDLLERYRYYYDIDTN